MLLEIILVWVLWTLNAPTWCYALNIIAISISVFQMFHSIYKAGKDNADS